MAKPNNNFTIVIPTYTGQEHLPACFDSILSQKLDPKIKFDIVVVIDGPNQQIKQITDSYQSKFTEREIAFKVNQLPVNQGRFEARLKGAQLAQSKQLLFIDDRITFKNNYFKTLINLKQPIIIPNVVEAEAKNQISRSLYLLRRLAYGKRKFGASFKSYFIDDSNFEKSPKGTTSFWVPKTLFIDASRTIANDSASNKHVNDDTKLFKYIINQKLKIFKSGEAKIFYNPRSSTWAEIEHLYHRGPRFVDYYIKRGTRFFWPLIFCIAIALTLIVILILKPGLLLAGLIGLAILDIILTVVLAEKLKDLSLVLYYPVIVVAFALGVIKGLFLKALSLGRS